MLCEFSKSKMFYILIIKSHFSGSWLQLSSSLSLPLLSTIQSSSNRPPCQKSFWGKMRENTTKTAKIKVKNSCILLFPTKMTPYLRRIEATWQTTTLEAHSDWPSSGALQNAPLSLVTGQNIFVSDLKRGCNTCWTKTSHFRPLYIRQGV